MDKETFKRYQRELNSRRENELKYSPKLSPKVLLNDEDLVFEDIEITSFNISMPNKEVKNVVKEKHNKSLPLF